MGEGRLAVVLGGGLFACLAAGAGLILDPTVETRLPPKPFLLPVFTAGVEGTITTEAGGAVALARIFFEPQGLTVFSNKGGYFRAVLPLTRTCQLITITVTARGFGLWRSIDDPVYAGMGHTLDVILDREPLIDTLGPPLLDDGDCARG
jgi:hypothetical protein